MSDPVNIGRYVWGTRPCTDGFEGEIEGVEDTKTGLFYGFTHPMLPLQVPEDMKTGILRDFVENDGPNKYQPLDQ